MTKTQKDILFCLRLNVSNARKTRSREYAKQRLAEYERELAKRQEPARENPFTRFEQNLENEKQTKTIHTK
jgi:hypothetical protein